jgi:drug/metabolite transporter (DMT)-like permease
MRPRRSTVAAAQAVYYLPTAIVPFLSRTAFERVTGHKREWWLVLTVGGLVGSISAALAVAARGEPGPETVVLGVGSAAALGLVDIVYVRRGRLRRVYLLDAAVELPIVLAWIIARRG